ncbi:preprotein translocase subunit YajC [Krasilnikoviella flava]|uniref:Preprotein translocase subunit YajC n=1 Tax=Krasilnikoviella flava TaxID=526729 RepID=A0A1T5L6G1_9MICO|nr:preprotein translocase subunit YajC [Krasilnikoviella flava]SKC71524.1 preprotein translocase subunit YajC [Krasilnikoviella flava]
MELIILFVVLAGLMFFMSQRTRKQQKQQAEFRSQLEPGQEVMTGSGLFGTVVEVDEANDTVTIESTPGSQTRWLRAAIAKRIDTPADEAALATDETDVTTDSAETGTITSGDAHVDVPDDLSSLDTAQREYRDQQRRDEGEAGSATK